MRKRKEYEESLLRNSCMQMNSPDTVAICDAIGLATEALLDIRQLLQDLISGKNLIEKQVQEIKMQKIDPKILKKL